MVVLRGWQFLMSEVPLYGAASHAALPRRVLASLEHVVAVQGYLAHKKQPPPLGTTKGP